MNSGKSWLFPFVPICSHSPCSGGTKSSPAAPERAGLWCHEDGDGSRVVTRTWQTWLKNAGIPSINSFFHRKKQVFLAGFQLLIGRYEDLINLEIPGIRDELHFWKWRCFRCWNDISAKQVMEAEPARKIRLCERTVLRFFSDMSWLQAIMWHGQKVILYIYMAIFRDGHQFIDGGKLYISLYQWWDESHVIFLMSSYFILFSSAQAPERHSHRSVCSTWCQHYD